MNGEKERRPQFVGPVGRGRFPFQRSQRPAGVTVERMRWLLTEDPAFRGLSDGTQLELIRMLVLYANALGAFYLNVKKATDPERGDRRESSSTIRARLKRAVAAGVLHEFPWRRASGHQAPTVYVFALGRTKAEVAAELIAAGCKLEPAGVPSVRHPARSMGAGRPAPGTGERTGSLGTEAHGTADAAHAPLVKPLNERQVG